MIKSQVRGLSLERDIAWWEKGTCCLIGDVKYKRTDTGDGKNADLYQVLAYANPTQNNAPTDGSNYERVGGTPTPKTSEVGSAAREGDTGCSGGECRLRGHDCLVFDWGQAVEAGLASTAVVSAFDPGHDLDAELVSGRPVAAVEHVLLQ